MYVIGRDHPNREIAIRRVAEAIAQGESLVTDAEVLQELLHRYSSQRRYDALQPAFETLLAMVDEVIDIEWTDVDRAREILLAWADLSSRDAVHLATMEKRGIDRIMSFDAGFDAYPAVQRLAD